MPWSRVLTFSDPLSCQAAIPSADVEILPTTKEDFEVEITQVGADRLCVQCLHASAPALCTVACKPELRSIGFLTESNSSPLQHCGLEVLPGTSSSTGLTSSIADQAQISTTDRSLSQPTSWMTQSKRSSAVSFWKNQIGALSIHILN